jgi:hypothetical protein
VQLLVRILRRRGVPLSPQQEAELPWTLVSILTERDERTGRRRLVLRGHDEGLLSPPRRELYQVTLASVTHTEIVLRGIEQVDMGGCAAAVVQEWAFKPAPELGPDGWSSARAREFTRDLSTLVDPPRR